MRVTLTLTLALTLSSSMPSSVFICMSASWLALPIRMLLNERMSSAHAVTFPRAGVGAAWVGGAVWVGGGQRGWVGGSVGGGSVGGGRVRHGRCTGTVGRHAP